MFHPAKNKKHLAKLTPPALDPPPFMHSGLPFEWAARLLEKRLGERTEDRVADGAENGWRAACSRCGWRVTDGIFGSPVFRFSSVQLFTQLHVNEIE